VVRRVVQHICSTFVGCAAQLFWPTYPPAMAHGGSRCLCVDCLSNLAREPSLFIYTRHCNFAGPSFAIINYNVPRYCERRHLVDFARIGIPLLPPLFSSNSKRAGVRARERAGVAVWQERIVACVHAESPALEIQHATLSSASGSLRLWANLWQLFGRRAPSLPVSPATRNRPDDRVADALRRLRVSCFPCSSSHHPAMVHILPKFPNPAEAARREREPSQRDLHTCGRLTHPPIPICAAPTFFFCKNFVLVDNT